MTDGTRIKWRQSHTGYYVPQSFAPQSPDGFILWGYAMAYRLTADNVHWQMVREIGRHLDLGDIGQPDGSGRKLRFATAHNNWRTIYALLELYRATDDRSLLQLACRIADNILTMQTQTGLFPRPGRVWARTGDDIPLALLHLAAAIDGNLQDALRRSSPLPPAVFDHRFFHCEYHGHLDEHQQKRADKRTYDNLVFYGGS
jgi:pectate lyase